MAATTPAARRTSAAAFAVTRWSLVLAAGGDGSRSTAALAQLCQSYWYPLYAFVRRQGHSPHDAQDLTQEFFARLLAREWLGQAQQERGRFRSFLLTAMKHFLANERDRQHAQKRGGGQALLSLDEEAAEARYRLEPGAADPPEALFDRRWAHTVLEHVLARLREEWTNAGNADLFDAMKGLLSGEPTSHGDVAGRLGKSEGAIKVAAHRLRARYRALLRRAIAETVPSPAEVDDELRHLFAALSNTPMTPTRVQEKSP